MKRKKNITKPTLYDLLEFKKFKEDQSKLADYEKQSEFKRNLNELIKISEILHSKKEDKKVKVKFNLFSFERYKFLFLNKYSAILFLVIFLGLLLFGLNLYQTGEDLSEFKNDNITKLEAIDHNLHKMKDYDFEKMKGIKEQFLEVLKQTEEMKQSKKYSIPKEKIEQILQEFTEKDVKYAKSQLLHVKQVKDNVSSEQLDKINNNLSHNYTYIESFNKQGFKVDLFEYANVVFDINDEIKDKDTAKEWFIKIITQRKDDINTALRAVKMGEWFIEDKEFIDAKTIFQYILSAYAHYEEVKAIAQLDLAYCLYNVGRDENFPESLEIIKNQPETLTLNDETSNRIKGLNLLLKYCDIQGNINEYAKKYLDLKHQSLVERLFYIAKRYTNYIQYTENVTKLEGLILWEDSETFYQIAPTNLFKNHSIKKYKVIEVEGGMINQYKFIEVDTEITVKLSEKFYKIIYDKIKIRTESSKQDSVNSNIEKLSFQLVEIRKTNSLIKNESVIILTVYCNENKNQGTKIFFFRGAFDNLELVETNIVGDFTSNNLIQNYRVNENFQIKDVDNDGLADILLASGVTKPRCALVLFQKESKSKNALYFQSVSIKNSFGRTDLSFIVCDDFNKDGRNEIIVAYKSWSAYRLILYTYNLKSQYLFKETDSFLLGTAVNHYVITENDTKYLVVNSTLKPSYGDFYIGLLNKTKAESGIYVFKISEANKFDVVSQITLTTDFVSPTNIFIQYKQISEMNIRKYRSGYVLEYNIYSRDFFDLSLPKKNYTVFSFISCLNEINNETNKTILCYEGIHPRYPVPDSIRLMQSFKTRLNRCYVNLREKEIKNIKNLNYKRNTDNIETEYPMIFNKLQLHEQNKHYIETQFQISNRDDSSIVNVYIDSIKKLIKKKVVKSFEELNTISNVNEFKHERNMLYYESVHFLINNWGHLNKENIKLKVIDFIAEFIMETNDKDLLYDYLSQSNLPENTRILLNGVLNTLNMRSVIEYNNGKVLQNGTVIKSENKFHDYYSYPLNVVSEEYDKKQQKHYINYSISKGHYLGNNRINETSIQSIDTPQNSFFGNVVDVDKDSSFKFILDVNYKGLPFGHGRDIGLFKIQNAFLNSNQINIQSQNLDSSYVYMDSSGGGMNVSYSNNFYHRTYHPKKNSTSTGLALHENYKSENCRFIIEYNCTFKKLLFCIYDLENEKVLYRMIFENVQPLSKGKYYFGICTNINETHVFPKNNFRISRLSLYGEKINLVKNTSKVDFGNTYSTISYLNRLILMDDKAKIIESLQNYVSFLNKLFNEVSQSNKELVMREITIAEMLSVLYQHEIEDTEKSLHRIYMSWEKFRSIERANFIIDEVSNEKKHWNLIYNFLSRLNDYGYYNNFVLSIGEAIYRFDDRYCNYTIDDMYQKLIRRHYTPDNDEYNINTKDLNGIEDITISFYLLNKFKESPQYVEKYKVMTWINTDLLLAYNQISRLPFYDFNELFLSDAKVENIFSNKIITEILDYYEIILGMYGFVNNALEITERLINSEYSLSEKILKSTKLFRLKYKLINERLLFQKKYLDLQYNSFYYHND